MRFRKILQQVIPAIVILLAFSGCGAPTATPTPTPTPAPTSPPVTPTSTFGDWLRVTPTISSANVDVGDYELFISCQGEGSPTVVFEAGWGVHDRWTSVLPATAKLTRACRYNRHFAGVDEEPRTAQQMVDDMHRLLVNAGVEGPYVLVGHSFGGLIARRRLLRLVLRGHLFTYRSQSGAGGMVPAVAPG